MFLRKKRFVTLSLSFPNGSRNLYVFERLPPSMFLGIVQKALETLQILSTQDYKEFSILMLNEDVECQQSIRLLTNRLYLFDVLYFVIVLESPTSEAIILLFMRRIAFKRLRYFSNNRTGYFIIYFVGFYSTVLYSYCIC